MRYKPRKSTIEMKRRILVAASEVIGAKGSSDATLEEIASKVGLTRAGLLHHFGSKRNLLLEVVKFRDTHDLEELQGQRMPENGRDYFLHLFSTMRVNETRPGIIRTFMVLAGESLVDDNPGTSYYQTRYQTLRREISHAMTDLASTHGVTIDADTCAWASAAVIAIMDGLQLQWLHAPGQVKLADDAERSIRAILSTAIGLPSDQLLGKSQGVDEDKGAVADGLK